MEIKQNKLVLTNKMKEKLDKQKWMIYTLMEKKLKKLDLTKNLMMRNNLFSKLN